MTNNCCNICGIPLDAEYFDVSGILENKENKNQLPKKGERAVLASFQIHPQYCGVLECFAQFTDLYAHDNSMIDTPGLFWMILRNGQPVFPYHQLESIVNPWGYNNFSFMIRLEENAKVEFVIYNRAFDFADQEHPINKVGGRIMGRYWYNPIYGGRRK
jgi:hypothetical protein